MPPSDYCSPDEFSALSGLSPATVRRRLKSNQLPSVQPGGRGHRVLIPRDALEQLARVQPPPPEPDAANPAPTTAGPADPDSPRTGPRPRWLAGPNF